MLLRHFRVQQFQVGAHLGLVQGLDLPKARIARLGDAARGQQAYGVALAHGAQRQLNGFGAVALDVQAKGQARGQGIELALQVGAQFGVSGPGLGNQITDGGHAFFLPMELHF